MIERDKFGTVHLAEEVEKLVEDALKGPGAVRASHARKPGSRIDQAIPAG